MNSFKVKFTNDNERSTVDSLLKHFPKFPKYYTRLRDKILAMGRPSTIEIYITNLAIQAGVMVACYQEVREGGAEIRFPQSGGNLDKGPRLDNKKRKYGNDLILPASSKMTISSMKCDGCGGKNHVRADCLFNTHPDYNIDTSCDWATSDKGKAWKQQRGLERLAWHVDSLDGTFKGKSNPSHTLNTGRSGASGPKTLGIKKSFSHKKNRESLLNITLSNPTDHTNTLLPTVIMINHVDKRVESLIDTGALQANYISQDIAEWLESHGAKYCSCSASVCNAVGGCSRSRKSFNFDVLLTHELNHNKLKLSITAKVISSDYDLIIGLPDIRRYNLLNYFSYKFCANVVPDRSQSSIGGPSQRHELVQSTELSVVTLAALHEANIKPKRMLLDYEEDADDLIDELVHTSPWEIAESDISNYNLTDIRIEGSEQMKESIKNLISEFQDIFSPTLDSNPALLPPMELKINTAKWEVKSNSMPLRTQSVAKEAEIQIQTTKLRNSNRIIPCLEPYYSQVHLAKPPNKDTYRFCIDYRNLNNATENISWPLPIIENMLRRLGSKRPRYFATIDMTSGYHQIGIHPDENSL
jgi:hypothetical protein